MKRQLKNVEQRVLESKTVAAGLFVNREYISSYLSYLWAKCFLKIFPSNYRAIRKINDLNWQDILLLTCPLVSESFYSIQSQVQSVHSNYMQLLRKIVMCCLNFLPTPPSTYLLRINPSRHNRLRVHEYIYWNVKHKISQK